MHLCQVVSGSVRTRKKSVAFRDVGKIAFAGGFIRCDLFADLVAKGDLRPRHKIITHHDVFGEGAKGALVIIEGVFHYDARAANLFEPGEDADTAGEKELGDKLDA